MLGTLGYYNNEGVTRAASSLRPLGDP